MTCLEKIAGCARADGAVFNLRLTRQVFGRIDGSHHSLDSEESGQVGSVRRDENQGEEPPNGTDHTTRYRSNYIMS